LGLFSPVRPALLERPDTADAPGSFAPVRGLFVTFEGIDRSGKSTQAALLAEALGDGAVLVREPGGTAAGERVRDLLKDPGVELSPEAEALLFAAARAQLVREVVEPALARGLVVVSDRYLDSSLAYQGVARGLGVDAVARVNELATGGLAPDLTVLLELPTGAAAARGREADRFEDEGEGLQQAVAMAYADLAQADPGRWRRVAAERNSHEVHAEVLAAVQELIGARRAPA
jgi:dTMP kinase